jgi:hypothetical protein
MVSTKSLRNALPMFMPHGFLSRPLILGAKKDEPKRRTAVLFQQGAD